MKRGMVAALAIFYVGGLGMIGGAVWTYLDEHSGTASTAHITECHTNRTGKYSGIYCSGTWKRGERTVTGEVFNAGRSDIGKDVSVRLHGSRASKPQLSVSIALALFGVFILSFGIWLTARARRPGFASSPASPDR